MKHRPIVVILIFCFFLSSIGFGQTSTQRKYSYDAAGNRILRAQSSVPDLTVSNLFSNLNFSPSEVGMFRDFIVSISEINTVTTTGEIKFRISKLSAFTITCPSSNFTADVLGGVPTTNSDWTVAEDSGFITLTSTLPILAFTNKIIGFRIARKPNVAPDTQQNITVTIFPNAGGENNFSNNIAVTTVTAN